MNERGLELLEEYELEVLSVRRGRGAVLCETDRGLMLWRTCSQTEERIGREAGVLEALSGQGFLVDEYQKTRQGTWIAGSEGGERCTLKRWYAGRECDVKNISEVLTGTAQLARLHRALEALTSETEGFFREDVTSELEKHTRELRRARQFISRSRKKGSFELLVLRNFDSVFREAALVMEELHRQPFPQPEVLRHGAYTYHELLMEPGGPAVTNFGHLCIGLPVRDLYQFMRKVLEKQNFSVRLGEEMLRCYDRVRPLGEEEWRGLYLLFSYPEKFWKQMNHYFNANKAWVPERNVEKLKNIEKQQSARQEFLTQLFKKMFK